MYRMIYEDLVRWKCSESRKPLILEGVRQCGKTYLLKEFGKNEYEDTAYFNFEDAERISSIFDTDLDPHRIIEELGVFRKRPIVPGRTLLIFDEIQFCNRAITSLKYFCENAPEHHVICAGSLLGVLLSKPYSFPVGKVDRMRMYPMSFKEFLIANGEEMLCDHVESTELGSTSLVPFSMRLSDYLKRYYITGGMPEVVKEWVSNKDVRMVEKIQNRILKDYVNDFAKHAEKDVNELTQIWRSIPEQLSKENKRFIFSHVRTGARSRDLEKALEWLISAGLVHKVTKVSGPMVPLSAYSDSTVFKIYFSDVGLLRKLADVDPGYMLEQKEEFKHFKGAMAENFVLNELLQMEKQPYYWHSDGNSEVDFVAGFGTKQVPIEVKAEKNNRSKSLGVYIEKYNPEVAIKTSMNGIGRDDNVISVPLWMIWKLNDLGS